MRIFFNCHRLDFLQNLKTFQSTFFCRKIRKIMILSSHLILSPYSRRIWELFTVNFFCRIQKLFTFHSKILGERLSSNLMVWKAFYFMIRGVASNDGKRFFINWRSLLQNNWWSSIIPSKNEWIFSCDWSSFFIDWRSVYQII